jgi:DNA-binding SARP family transcriptional activator/WD40 repeat protein
MRIAVLGPLEVVTEGRAPVPVPGAKERLLLAVLAAHAPAVVSTDCLVETLWDGDAPPSARKSLQAHVVRLRSALEPDRPRGSSGRYVVRRGAGYALAVDREDLDWMRLTDAAARGRALLSSGDAAVAERILTAALDLWRGEPYADWPDAPFADAERRRLAEVRSTALAELMAARLALGRHEEVVADLQKAVHVDPLREDWWRLLMLALYRSGRQAEALAAARRARSVLAEELGADPGPALRAMESAVLDQDPELDLARRPPAAAPAAGERCPFMGLAAYQAVDAPLFQGRRRLISSLVARLVDAPVVAVSGPSGAGKSSVVRAGVVPALAGGAMGASATWQPLVLTPGRRPVDVLAPLTGEEPPAGPALLVCDQLEELWAPEVDPQERTAFLDTVLGLMDDGIVVRCVAVVRGDHAGRLAEHAAFAERVAGAMVLVPPLIDPELREIVREPARAVGLDVEPELLDAVVADVLGRPGALPLLSTALVGTWERRRGSTLTLAGYLDAGGVSGALTRTAEAAYAALDEEVRADARRLLVRLADVDDGGALVRRSLPLRELDLDETPRSGRRVVETFVGRRLLSVDGDCLEVTHEALLTGWPRLARWLEEDATGRQVRRHLAPVVREWAARGRPVDELYRGARLAAALDWAARDDAQPSPLERQFLVASQERADAELREARDQVARERRARRRTRRLAALLAAVLAVALAATVLAVRFQQNADARAIEAERLSLVADANRLAALAEAEEAVDVSLLLGAQAVRLAATHESRHQLLGTLLDRRRALGVVSVSEPPVRSTLAGDTLYLDDGRGLSAWPVSSGSEPHEAARPIGTWGRWIVADGSPTDGRLVAAGVDIYDQMWVRLLRPDATTTELVQSGRSPGVPLDVTFTGDGRRVLIVTADMPTPNAPRPWQIIEIDLSGAGSRETGIAGTLPVGADPPAVDISDDARLAVVSSQSGAAVTATLVDLADGRQVPLLIPQRGVASNGFRALDSGVAQLWADGAVTRYGMDGHPLQQLDAAGPDPAQDVVVSPDATWAAVVGGGGRVTIWNVDPGTAGWTLRTSFVGHDGDIRNAEATADGARLVTVGADNRLVAWDVTPRGTFGTPVGVGGDRRLASRPQVVEPGRLVAALTRPGGVADASGTEPWPAGAAVTFFDLRTGDVVDSVTLRELHPVAPLALTPADAEGPILSMSVSPDRRRIAVTTGLTVTVIDAGRREPLHSFDLPADGVMARTGSPLPAAPVLCLEWTSDSSQLVLGTGRFAINEPLGALVRVDPSTGEEEAREPIGSVPDGIIAHPDEPTLVVSDLDGGVQVFDERTLGTGRYVASVKRDRVTSMSFSPDRLRLVVTDESNRLYLLDPETGRFTEHEFAWDLLQAEWLPDSRTIALSSTDGSVRLYDPEGGELLTPAFSASGDNRAAHVRLLVSTDELVALSGERPGRRWPLDPAAWVEEACAAVGRDFSRSEWERYLPDRPYRQTCTDLD